MSDSASTVAVHRVEDRKQPIFGSKDEGFKKQRKDMVVGTLKVFTLTTVMLWIALPIFWGSTWLILPYLRGLPILYVNFDNTPTSILGPAYTNFVQKTIAEPRAEPHLGYAIRDASLYPNGLSDVMKEITNQNYWGAVVVNANATSAWREAAETAGGDYSGAGAVSIFYEGARFYQVILLYLKPLFVSNADEVLSTASLTTYATLLSSLDTTYSPPAGTPSITPLTTSLAIIESKPALLGSPFGYATHDLRPQTAWSAAAVFEASNIYFLIFAFHLVVWHAIGRQKSDIEKKLTLTGLIRLRLMVPAIAYFFMALWYSCIIAAFQVPFDTTLGRAGFVADWALNYVALLAMGLAFETMFSVLTIKFLPFFLIFWIITNITSSFFPIHLMERFYRFLYWAPFYHQIEASKIIFFGTGPAHQLGVHFGVLFAVASVNIVGLSLGVWFERWRAESSERKDSEKAKGNSS